MFVKKMRALRDPETLELPIDFRNELYKWALEYSEPQIMINCVHDVFDLVYRLEILPSLWKIYNTRNLKKFFRMQDTLNRISSKHIEQAKAKLHETTDDDTNLHDYSILKKLLRLDKQTAQVMALDMLTAGIDTTGNAVGATLYYIANNPEKQEKLREEIMSLLPDKTLSITYKVLNQTRYTKTCSKESLRLFPIFIGDVKTMQTDVCIGGYKISAGEYIPERWLRSNTEFPSAKQAHPFAYMPFGFGLRSCRQFAEMQLETLLLTVIRNFLIEWHHELPKYENLLLNRLASPMRFKLIDL